MTGATFSEREDMRPWSRSLSCRCQETQAGLGTDVAPLVIVLGGHGVWPSTKPGRSYPNNRASNCAFQGGKLVGVSLIGNCVELNAIRLD